MDMEGTDWVESASSDDSTVSGQRIPSLNDVMIVPLSIIYNIY